MMSLLKPLQAEFSTKVKRLEEELKMPLISPTIELAREEGEQRGEQRGEQKVIIRQLNRRIGEIKQPIVEQIRKLPVEELEQLAEALLEFSTLANLEQWLNSRPKPVEQE